MLKSFGGAALAAAIVAAPVNAACWNSEETAAATVRELQSMLMVAALRCQVAQHDMTHEYNDFLKANKTLIQRGNDRLKAHFVKASGPVAGQRAYDAFATHLANGYGADGSSGDVCSAMASLAQEAALVAGDQDGLLLLADRQGLSTELPGGTCRKAPGKAPAALIASDAATGSTMAALRQRTATRMADVRTTEPLLADKR